MVFEFHLWSLGCTCSRNVDLKSLHRLSSAVVLGTLQMMVRYSAILFVVPFAMPRLLRISRLCTISSHVLKNSGEGPSSSAANQGFIHPPPGAPPGPAALGAAAGAATAAAGPAANNP